MSQIIEKYDNASNYTMSGVEIDSIVAKLLRNESSSLHTKTSNFTTSGDYTFDSAKIDLSSGQAKLKLPTASQSFSQTFASATGFTYDSAKAEFIGGLLRQIDKRPANATFYASYTSSIDGNWGGGTLTATNNGATLNTGNGHLEMIGGVSNKYVDYIATSNADSLQVGCVRFKIIPSYSGTPATNQMFFRISQANGSQNNIVGIFHANNGQMNIRVFSSTGVSIITNTALGLWSPVSGTEYEWEFNWDITTGASRLFLNGTQFGATQTNTGIRSGAVGLLRIGEAQTVASNFANFSLSSILYFSTVQHTANYTPGADPDDTIYVESNAVLPQFTHAQNGVIHSLSSLTTTESNSPRYFIKVGAGSFQYWNGSAWVVSNQSYAQSSTAANISSNLGTLGSVDGSTQITMGVSFPAGNTQASIDLLTLNYNGDTAYATDNPTITMDAQAISEAVGLASVDSMSATIVATGSDAVQFSVSNDLGVTYYYWNGSAWAASTTYTQSNTLAVIFANISSLSLTGGKLKLKAYLHSATGATTPSLDDLVVTYRIFQYRTAGGTIEANTSFTAQELLEFLFDGTIPTSDQVKFGLRVNGSLMYYNGSIWTSSDGTNTQLNTAGQWTGPILEALLSVNSTIKLFARLTSNDGSTTPEIDETTVTFNAGAVEEDSADQCLVTAFIQNLDGTPAEGVQLDFYPAQNAKQYLEASSHIMTPSTLSVTTDENGYADISLAYSSQFENGPMPYFLKMTYPNGTVVQYKNKRKNEFISIIVPDAIQANLTDLISGIEY